jgi:hypothetical protein
MHAGIMPGSACFPEKTAEDMDLRDSSVPQQYQTNKYLESSLRGVTWSNAHGRNCNEGIAGIENNLRAYRDTPDRRQLQTLLSGLKSAQ